ncbi:MAG: hypothetical protein Kow00129_11600 [Thermoleophilia bacterium]
MARRDKDFLGLEVVSLEDASVVGEIDGLVVDEEQNKVVGFVVDMGLYEAKILPLSDTQTVGEDAVLVSKADVVKPISQSGQLQQIAERGIHPDDALVITDKGDVIGVTGDFFVDPADGSLKGIEVLVGEDSDERTLVVGISSVVRIGSDIVLVSADYDTAVVGSGEDL